MRKLFCLLHVFLIFFFTVGWSLDSNETLKHTLLVSQSQFANEVKEISSNIQENGYSNAKDAVKDKYIEKIKNYPLQKSQALFTKANQKINQTGLLFLKRLKIQPQYSYDLSQYSLKANTLGQIYHSTLDIIFAQLNGSYTNDSLSQRPTTNVGVGYRHLFSNANIIIGVNSFFDYDFSGNNSRFSIGEEIKSPYLSLYSNQYQRISDWHHTPFDNTIMERTANGFDVGVSGQIPWYPQIELGASYVKWYGHSINAIDPNEVNEIADDPATYNYDLSYHPNDLLDVEIDRAQGANNAQSNLEYKIGFDINFNESLDKQLRFNWKPETQKAFSEHLYDLVKRENQIILEHYKLPLITLSPKEITVKEGSYVTINAKTIERDGSNMTYYWNSTPLTFDELGVTGDTKESKTPPRDIHFIAPPYNIMGQNDYTISLHAFNSIGQISDRVVVHVVPISFSAKIELADSGVQPINGEEFFTAHLNGGVAPFKVHWSVTPKTTLDKQILANSSEGQLKNADEMLASYTTPIARTYIVKLTAMDAFGKIAIDQKEITFLTASVKQSYFEVDPLLHAADNKDNALLSLYIRDSKNQVISNYDRKLVNITNDKGVSLNLGEIKFIDGHYELPISTLLANNYKIAVSIGVNHDDLVTTHNDIAHFFPLVNKGNSYFDVENRIALADGRDKLLVKVGLYDVNGHPVVVDPKIISYTSSENNASFGSLLTDPDGDGVYNAYLYSKANAQGRLSFNIGNISIPVLANDSYTFLKTPQKFKSVYNTPKAMI